MILVAAGLYQMTPLQARCLASCNRHLGAPSAHAGEAHLSSAPHTLHAHPSLPDALQDISAGLAHGRDCLGTCGGYMLALVGVGLMNLPWMIAITLIVLVEKVWRYGDRVAKVVGLGLMLLGILMVADPHLIFG
jgi:predicted metal-binding membrane protein